MPKKDNGASSEKVFGIRGFEEKYIKAVKILALKKDKTVKDLMTEAVIDLLRKYKEPIE